MTKSTECIKTCPQQHYHICWRTYFEASDYSLPGRYDKVCDQNNAMISTDTFDSRQHNQGRIQGG